MPALNPLLYERMAAAPEGRLTFAEVMALALYHLDHGYYGRGPRRIGRKGDFFTAVSVGPLYGRLLASLAAQAWEEAGRPGDFVIMEQGAHDGQLAADILAAAGEWAAEYWIVEPNPAHERAQRERLAPHGQRVRWVGRLADLPGRAGLFVCNELPDALPVHLVRREEEGWRELYVAAGPGGEFEFVPGPLSSDALGAEVARLPADLPPGYTTEVNLAALAWMGELAAAPFGGVLCIADYGLDAVELYAPERTAGTLRRYRQHQMDDKVLEDLGECDLTTHVNFTSLIEVAEAGGLRLRSYEHQGRFLGRLALPWLASLEGRPPDAETQALLRQYQSLTHPGIMGRSFRVVVLGKNR